MLHRPATQRATLYVLEYADGSAVGVSMAAYED